MPSNRTLSIIIILLVIPLLIVAFGGGFNCSAHAQTLEVIPNATQPAAGPMIKMETVWTPTAITTMTLAILGGIATILIPSIIALVKASRAEVQAQGNKERLDRQGEVQKQQLIREGQVPPPGGA